MANTKKMNVKEDIVNEKTTDFELDKNTSEECFYGPSFNSNHLEELNKNIWVPVNGDNNTRSMFVGSGSVILTYTSHGISSCYVPNVIYANNRFERI